MLLSSPYLTHLLTLDDSISDEGIEALAHAMKSNLSLTELNLFGSSLTISLTYDLSAPSSTFLLNFSFSLSFLAI